MFGDVGLTGGIGGEGRVGELVDVRARLEAKAADKLHRGRLVEDGSGKAPCRTDDVGRGVVLVDRHTHLGRRRGDLLEGVDDAARAKLVGLGGDDVDAVGKGVEGFSIYHGTSCIGNDS